MISISGFAFSVFPRWIVDTYKDYLMRRFFRLLLFVFTAGLSLSLCSSASFGQTVYPVNMDETDLSGLLKDASNESRGWVCQQENLVGDYNDDCKVDIKDFALFAQAWLGEMKFEEMIVVMTYNIHHGEGYDEVFDLARIANVIRGSGADIVGLNEVDWNFHSRSEFLKEAKVLADEFGMHFVFGETLDRGDGQYYGNAILSRYPILTSKNHQLYYYEGSEQRGCLEAAIETPLGRFNVFSTHLDNSSSDGLAVQVDDLLDITAGKDHVILMGDFNQQTPRYSPDSQLRDIMLRYSYAYSIAGVGEPWTIVGSNIKFDFIFVSSEFYRLIKKCKVISTGDAALASDHYPVVMELSNVD